MKYTFTLLLTLLLSVAMYAGPKQSTITVSSIGNNSIMVIIDGKQYRANNNYVTINNLSAGYHTIKIYQQAGRRPNRLNNSQMIYNSSLYVKPMFDVDIIVSRFGKVFIDEQLNNGDQDWNDWDNSWNDNNWNWNDNNRNDRDNNYGYPNYRVMSETEFVNFKQTLNKQVFEDTKLSLAKQVASTNYFSTDQVKQLLKMFIFEDNKLALAKYAYKYTVDKNIYYTLVDEFIFSSNKNDLLEYIRKN